MATGISTFLRQADHICDYIPGISTLSNIADLFQKYVIFPSMSNESVVNNRYYARLDTKSIWRCIILCIPVIGNFVIGIYDFVNRKYNDKEFLFASAQQDGWEAFQLASDELKGDKEFMIHVCASGYWQAVQYASARLQDDKSVMNRAGICCWQALQYASARLRDDAFFMKTAGQRDREALEYASQQLKSSRYFKSLFPHLSTSSSSASNPSL